jgi:hypothetical protein
MPAQVIPASGTNYHIYNRGVENRLLFSDAEDFATFGNYLKDYVSPAVDPKTVRVGFTINGRDYKGTPHMPKNFYGKVELTAYSLMPDHYHLLIRELTPGSKENFIRSLCTRYSIYYNKKHSHGGSIFNGPYRSVVINEPEVLRSLVGYIHHSGNPNSSYSEYAGGVASAWINLIEVAGNQNVSLSPEFTLEGPAIPPTKAPVVQSTITPPPVGPPVFQHSEPKPRPKLQKNNHRIPEITALFAVFILLTFLGYQNISVSNAKETAKTATIGAPQVLAESTVLVPTPTPEPLPNLDPIKDPITNGLEIPIVEAVAESTPSASPIAITQKFITQKFIKINQDLQNVIIRSEPSIDSEKIATTQSGEQFGLLSETDEWYQIKVTETKSGYVSKRYGQITENE